MTIQIENRLLKRKNFGNLRELQKFESLIDFSSNDYLGLARSLIILTNNYSSGSTGSRLLNGNSCYAEDLEDFIAKFHGYDAGVLFNCGYMANLGLLSAIGEGSVIFFDAKVHASTHDGIRLSRATAFPFRHNDPEHLENRLKKCALRGDRFICIESIYSTDGSIAPLKAFFQLAKQYDAHLIVDEAHAVGVYGKNGRGLIEEPVFAKVTTFGKALGAHGAIVLGSSILKQALHNFANSFIYTTALPSSTLAAIKCSYDLFPKMDEERKHLQKLIQMFPKSSGTHIQSIPIPGNEAVKKVAESLVSLRYDVRPLLSPTVQRGKEMLRICLHAFNTENELKALLHHLSRYL